MENKKCRKCKMEIPKNASKCHLCGANQGMGCGGLIVIVIIILFCLFILPPMCAGCILIAGQDPSDGRPSITETSSAAPLMSKDEYIAGCKQIAYADLARNPDKYKGTLFTFTGEVIQVVEPTYGNTVVLRINVTQGEYRWTDTIYAEVEMPSGADRILANDIITIYGKCDGLYSYESILGEKISLPKIDIAYYNIEVQQ